MTMVGSTDDIRSGVHRIVQALGIHRSFLVDKLIVDVKHTLSRADSERHGPTRTRLITFALADLDLITDVLTVHVIKCAT